MAGPAGTNGSRCGYSAVGRPRIQSTPLGRTISSTILLCDSTGSAGRRSTAAAGTTASGTSAGTGAPTAAADVVLLSTGSTAGRSAPTTGQRFSTTGTMGRAMVDQVRPTSNTGTTVRLTQRPA